MIAFPRRQYPEWISGSLKIANQVLGHIDSGSDANPTHFITQVLNNVGIPLCGTQISIEEDMRVVLEHAWCRIEFVIRKYKEEKGMYNPC